jgi:hypothetical protein
MNLKALVSTLQENPSSLLHFQLPDGSFIPAHFHVTEVGRVQKDFVDCGGTIRSSTSCVLQVWVADDTHHRLNSSKLKSILDLGSKLLANEELPVEIEYQYGVLTQLPLSEVEVTPSGLLFHLGTKQTACLALDRCGLGTVESGCSPASGCC